MRAVSATQNIQHSFNVLKFTTKQRCGNQTHLESRGIVIVQCSSFNIQIQASTTAAIMFVICILTLGRIVLLWLIDYVFCWLLVKQTVCCCCCPRTSDWHENAKTVNLWIFIHPLPLCPLSNPLEIWDKNLLACLK